MFPSDREQKIGNSWVNIPLSLTLTFFYLNVLSKHLHQLKGRGRKVFFLILFRTAVTRNCRGPGARSKMSRTLHSPVPGPLLIKAGRNAEKGCDRGCFEHLYAGLLILANRCSIKTMWEVEKVIKIAKGWRIQLIQLLFHIIHPFCHSTVLLLLNIGFVAPWSQKLN